MSDNEDSQKAVTEEVQETQNKNSEAAEDSVENQAETTEDAAPTQEEEGDGKQEEDQQEEQEKQAEETAAEQSEAVEEDTGEGDAERQEDASEPPAEESQADEAAETQEETPAPDGEETQAEATEDQVDVQGTIEAEETEAAANDTQAEAGEDAATEQETPQEEQGGEGGEGGEGGQQEIVEEVTDEQTEAAQEEATQSEIVQNGETDGVDFTEEEVEEMTRMYKFCAGEEDRIDIHKFKKVLRCLGQNPTAHDVSEYFAQADTDDEGCINFDEFRRLYGKHKVSIDLQKEDLLRSIDKVFSPQDDDISIEKVQKFISKFSMDREESRLSETDIADLCTRIDQANDRKGRINRNELADVLLDTKCTKY